MLTENRIIEAVDVVLGWDLPDEAFAAAVKAQAEAMAALPRD